MFTKCRRSGMDLVALRGEMEARKMSLVPAGKEEPRARKRSTTTRASRPGSWPRSSPRPERSRRADMTTPVHLPGEHRFETTVDGHAGRLDYSVSGDVMTIVHTEVDPALEGRGVAGALVAGRARPCARKRAQGARALRIRGVVHGPSPRIDVAARLRGRAEPAQHLVARRSARQRFDQREAVRAPCESGLLAPAARPSRPCARASRGARTAGDRARCRRRQDGAEALRAARPAPRRFEPKDGDAAPPHLAAGRPQDHPPDRNVGERRRQAGNARPRQGADEVQRQVQRRVGHRLRTLPASARRRGKPRAACAAAPRATAPGTGGRDRDRSRRDRRAGPAGCSTGSG